MPFLRKIYQLQMSESLVNIITYDRHRLHDVVVLCICYYIKRQAVANKWESTLTFLSTYPCSLCTNTTTNSSTWILWRHIINPEDKGYLYILYYSLLRSCSSYFLHVLSFYLQSFPTPGGGTKLRQLFISQQWFYNRYFCHRHHYLFIIPTTVTFNS